MSSPVALTQAPLAPFPDSSPLLACLDAAHRSPWGCAAPCQPRSDGPTPTHRVRELLLLGLNAAMRGFARRSPKQGRAFILLQERSARDRVRKAKESRRRPARGQATDDSFLAAAARRRLAPRPFNQLAPPSHGSVRSLRSRSQATAAPVGAEAMAEEASLAHTPTWVLAAVCLVIVSISLVAERFLHRLGKVRCPTSAHCFDSAVAG
ncbi:hypothetical protein PR202_gb27884 [Eleusine coracana subsp. coracana]|uniref:Uncharacterized protein n=1 Tax=Eleusine coracana subsp. coracana TaxID=191504 RepID=A0AAV5FVF3_ELECO|nr:hypothetical protein PR202_gb27884 [Eleusine coracana subsp. coracana]